MIQLQSTAEIEELKQAGKVALVVTGDTCVPCKQLKEYIESDVQESFPDISFVTISGTQNRDWAVSQGIRTVPTTILYDDISEATATIKGYNPAQSATFKKELASFFNM